MGSTDVPIAIVGAGSLGIEPEGLRVRGIKQKSFRLLTTLLYLGVFAVFIRTMIVLHTDEQGTSKDTRYAFLIAAAAGAGGSVLLRKKKRAASEKEPEPIDHLIEWSSVKALVSSEALMIVRVVKPKGGYFFRASNPQELGAWKAALAAKGVKV